MFKITYNLKRNDDIQGKTIPRAAAVSSAQWFNAMKVVPHHPIYVPFPMDSNAALVTLATTWFHIFRAMQLFSGSFFFFISEQKISWEAVLVFGGEKSTAPGPGRCRRNCCCHPLFFLWLPNTSPFWWCSTSGTRCWPCELFFDSDPGPSRLTYRSSGSIISYFALTSGIKLAAKRI